MESDAQLAEAVAQGAASGFYRAVVAHLVNGIASITATRATLAAADGVNFCTASVRSILRYNIHRRGRGRVSH